MIEALSETANYIKETGIAEVEVTKNQAVKDSIPTIRESSLEALKAQNQILSTKNEYLAGKNHPETGIPFEERVVKVKEELKVAVTPNFDAVKLSEYNLPEKLYTATDKVQNNYCNKKLFEAYKAGELDTSKFSERQLKQIKNDDKPEGFTWHHDPDKGKMQLVPSDIHQKTGHDGGRKIWGGGTKAR